MVSLGVSHALQIMLPSGFLHVQVVHAHESLSMPQTSQAVGAVSALFRHVQALHVQSEAGGSAPSSGPPSGTEQTSHTSRAPLLTVVHARHAQLENSGSGPALGKWRARGCSQTEQARSPKYWPSISVFS